MRLSVFFMSEELIGITKKKFLFKIGIGLTMQKF